MVKLKRNIGWFCITFLFFYYLILYIVTPKEYLTLTYITDFTKHGVVHIAAISLAIGFVTIFLLAIKYDNRLGTKKYKKYLGRLFLNNPLIRRSLYLILALILGVVTQIIFTFININLMNSDHNLGIWPLLLFWAVTYTLSKDIASFITPKYRRLTFFCLIIVFITLFFSILWSKEMQSIFYNITAYFTFIWFIVLMFKNDKN